ncbi:hypothetical protein G3578_13285 [Brevibacillus sp. SYP-B805]|uniref:hypothetical protein n=1 Tax=Brevibacillus sp. SYP-B805 TaxID=1578199 RepID=UPI0013EA8034|nr:hypothetical protein [Brevibacillus sp. SYP-B805]NGQ96133.1 hypothetical protein [Brevibacillus sp. SYP-B805]
MQHSSLRAFFANLFDYAGLFPPAKLPLETSIQNYAAYRLSQDAWMLGRFIIPASRLNELDPYISLFSKNNRLTCAVLGRRSADAASCLEGLRADLALIDSFCERHGAAVDVGVLELPLPPSAPDPALLEAISASVSKKGMEVFLEVTVPLEGDWQNEMAATLEAVSEHNVSKGTTLGIKLRTGGLTAAAFPTPAQVAAVLVGCRDRNIPIKFTAGLHHPVRMYRDEVGTRMHGFLNVYTAGLLAHTENLTQSMTEEILSEESPSGFSFANDRLAWKAYSISAEEIARLRSTALRSYGTCSFDEPRDDLIALKIFTPGGG